MISIGTSLRATESGKVKGWDFLPAGEYLKPADVARVLCVDPKTVDALFKRPADASPGGPRLHGFTIPGRGTGRRMHKRIRRDSVVLLLIPSRAAQGDQAWRPEMLRVLSKLPPKHLRLLHEEMLQQIHNPVA